MGTELTPYTAPFIRPVWHDKIVIQPKPVTSYYELEGDCWCWTGWTNGRGHGRVQIDGVSWYVHRWCFEQFYKIQLFSGQVIDHLCRRRPCFQPLHLECVTALENYQRGQGGKQWIKLPNHAAKLIDFTPLPKGVTLDDMEALARGL